MSNIIGGVTYSTWNPLPTPPQLPNTISSTVRRRETSGDGEPGWTDPGAASQALVGARLRRSASEGPLSPKVTGSLDMKRIYSGGEGRGDQELAGKDCGGGPGRLLEVNQEVIRRRDLEGGRGGVGSRGEEKCGRNYRWV